METLKREIAFPFLDPEMRHAMRYKNAAVHKLLEISRLRIWERQILLDIMRLVKDWIARWRQVVGDPFQ